jgi:hypothetical protein
VKIKIYGTVQKEVEVKNNTESEIRKATDSFCDELIGKCLLPHSLCTREVKQ